MLERPARFQVALRRRYGEAATLQTIDGKLVMALTSEGARQILTADPDGYEPIMKRAFTGIVGTGSLWVMAGEQHRQERQLVAPPFHAQRVRGWGQTIQQLAREQTDRWQAGQELRAYPAMLDISRDLVLRVVLGVSEGDRLREGRRVLGLLLEASTPWISMVWAVQRWWFPSWRTYVRARNAFTRFVERELADRRARGSQSDDVLGLLLVARYADGSAIPDAMIRDELITILLAGHETTATALAWAVYELARHPDVLARLRAELDALGPNPEPDAIARQPYLSAVCNETLRLHTILTEVGRVPREPCTLLGYTIPVGVAISVGIAAIHHDPEIYPEPDRFRPERFLERTYSPFEFLPFGGGDRRCLGAALSDYEMRITLATVISSWDLESTGEDQDVRHNIGSGPKHGVPIRVHGRRQGSYARSQHARA
jgi:cytochrome P450